MFYQGEERIGTISHSGGIITLQASLIKIGGLWRRTTSALSVALPALTANTRYQVYAVESGGAVSLVISTNENSVGPAGFTRWALVGSFQSNGLGSVAFGSFINIYGTPKTDPIEWTPVFTGFGSPSSIQGIYWRFGERFFANVRWLGGVPTAVEPRVTMPAGLTGPTVVSQRRVGTWTRNNGGGVAVDKGGWLLLQSLSAYVTFSQRIFSTSDGSWDNAITDATAMWGVGGADETSIEWSTPVNQWNSTQIKDL